MNKLLYTMAVGMSNLYVFDASEISARDLSESVGHKNNRL